MKNEVIKSLVLLVFFTSFLQFDLRGSESVDSLIVKLNQLKEGEEKLKLLIKVSQKYNWIDKDEAVPFIKESIAMARRLGNDIELGNALLEKYENLMTSVSSDSLQYLLKETKEAYERADYQLGLASLLVGDALDAEASGNLTKSMELFFQSQKIFEELGEEKEYNSNWISIAGLFSTMGRYDDALSYLEKSREYILNNEDPEGKGYFYLVQADIYKYMGAKELMKKAFENCLQIALANDYLNDVVSSATNLGIYALQKDSLKKASQYFEIAMDYAEQLKGKYFSALARKGKAMYHLRMKEYEQAKTLLLKAKPILDEPVYAYFQNDIHKYLGYSYEGLQMYDSAYFSIKYYSIKEDSVHLKESKRIASEIEAIYQNEKKEQELLQNAREKKFMYAIIGLLGLASLALVWAFRQKRKSNILLEEKNEQKEYLIKEIHHRVKNNLQIISSLLNLQSNIIDNEKAVGAVLDGRNRVQSMSLIHQKLYTGDNLAEVNMNEYLNELAEHMLHSFGKTNGSVIIQNNVAAPSLDVDSAIPLGLIINELLTNSLKYAFPNGQEGSIDVDLFYNKDEYLTLKVSDNGIGVNKEPSDDSNSTKFGSNMIHIFCKKLKGEITERKSKNGFETIIVMKKITKAKA